MLTKEEIKTIKETADEFFQKMTMPAHSVEADFSSGGEGAEEEKNEPAKDVVNLNIRLDEPQILIGERGQTLFEIQKLLKIVLNKKLQKFFYLNLDINDYKKKKDEYLKSFAEDLANEVAFTKEEKVLLPMSPYERRVIHAELSKRPDITTESRGDEPERYVVIKPAK